MQTSLCWTDNSTFVVAQIFSPFRPGDRVVFTDDTMKIAKVVSVVPRNDYHGVVDPFLEDGIHVGPNTAKIIIRPDLVRFDGTSVKVNIPLLINIPILGPETKPPVGCDVYEDEAEAEDEDEPDEDYYRCSC